jgi:hypothetical protein
MAGISEFVGGLLFAFGFITSGSALVITVVMLNAIATVHWKKGFFNYAGGYEYNLLIMATALAVTATGPGRYSLDHAFDWATKISGPWWALGIIVIAPIMTFATLTLGREKQPSAIEGDANSPKAPS